MSREAIKDWTGKVVGWIDKDDRGNKTIREYNYKIVGKYDSSTNTTRDFHGRVVAKGDHIGIMLNKK